MNGCCLWYRGGNRGPGKMEQWPRDRPHQLRFVLYKENLTTTQVRGCRKP